MEQPRLEKELMTLLMLSGQDRPSIKQISSRIHASTSTVYRYIRLFKSQGFVIKKSSRGFFHVIKMPEELSDFSNVVYFSEEEAYIINSMIASLDNTNALKQNIMKKLASIYRCTNLASFVYQKEITQNIRLLSQAIKKQRKVILRHYSSSHSNTIKDRLVEPYELSPNYSEVGCYDLEKNCCKTFKISRIREVEVLEDRWEMESRHFEEGSDLFRIHGKDREHIVLEMGIMAKNLLVEEFPLAEKQLKRRGEKWILDTNIYGMEGAGRFVIGLASDIRIVKGKKLKEYIRTFVNGHLLEYVQKEGE